MKRKKIISIKESEVEEALVTNLDYLKKLLQLPNDLKLIARQLKLKSGEKKLDLLLTHGKELCLLELKVVGFVNKHITQIINYRNELLNLQSTDKLVAGNIRCFLLVTDFDINQKSECDLHDIEIIKYDPLDLLDEYYQNLSTLTPFFKIKPKDYGVFNIGLIHRTIKKISQGVSTKDRLCSEIKLSKGSIHNHLRIAREFGIVRQRNNKYFLTDFGDKYVLYCNDEIFIEELSFQQSELLKSFIAKDPFFSSTVFGIYCIVESALTLSRNNYPIEFDALVKIFKTISGKDFEWKAKRSQTTATYTFLNFAIDLGLLGKIGKKIIIAPSGFRFILMLQLYKSIDMVRGLTTKSVRK